MKRLLAVLLSVFMVIGLVSCGGSKTGDEKTDVTTTKSASAETTSASADAPQAEHEADTLVIANTDMNEVFSPFFSNTVPDLAVWQNVLTSFIGFDKNAIPDNSGFAEADWEHPEKIGDGDSAEYKYHIKLKDNMKMPDGTPLTADDAIFSMKVLLDPTYDGATTLWNADVKGSLEYKYDDPNYKENLAKIDEEVANYQPTDEEIEAKAKALFDEYSKGGADVKLEQFQKDGEDFEGETLNGLKEDKKTELTLAYINKNIEDGIDYPDIEGVKKINDYEMEITLSKLNPKAIYSLSFSVAPMSYYGEGFKKGDLSGVKAKNAEPKGAGPYEFKGLSNNVVSFVANPNYYKGEPKIKNLKLQVVDQTNMLEAAARGDVDISEPQASPDQIKEAEKHENIHTELIDNNGYGYIGVNAERISDKLVRQGIFHLLDRRPAVEAAYGELASVIERPISQVNWAYPENATEYYGFDPEKAKAKFEEAGYKLEDGKLMKDGKQLQISCAYPGGASDDHPVKPVFAKLKSEGEKLGMKVDLQNMDGNPFFAAMQAGTLDMWAAAWQATPDPDMTQIYRSDGPTNHYHIKNPELDKLIDEGLQHLDRETRKEIYSKALDIIMEEAVEMPFYQRKNMVVINQDVVDVDSLPEELTPFWGYTAEIENLELVK